jgi:hypothetical protein
MMKKVAFIKRESWAVKRFPKGAFCITTNVLGKDKFITLFLTFKHQLGKEGHYGNKDSYSKESKTRERRRT